MPKLAFRQETVDAWVKSWNTYDLSQVDSLFLPTSQVTYFSSEYEGAVKGIDKLREHHAGFGFVKGGKTQPNKLWLEDADTQAFEGCVIVTAIWCFKRPSAATPQRGPVTIVYVPYKGEWRIAHANFGNYKPK